MVPTDSVARNILSELLAEGAGPVKGFGCGYRARQKLLPQGSIQCWPRRSRQSSVRECHSPRSVCDSDAATVSPGETIHGFNVRPMSLPGFRSRLNSAVRLSG